MNSDVWPGAHSVPCCGEREGRLRLEAPRSAHSQSFIYGPLHFWLWRLQYLSSYLNCIFKDFIQYLHAIRYELICFSLPTIFCLFVYLIVFILAWSVAIIHKHAPLDLFFKCYGVCSLYFCVCHNSDDSWTPEHEQVLENICWMS